MDRERVSENEGISGSDRGGDAFNGGGELQRMAPAVEDSHLTPGALLAAVSRISRVRGQPYMRAGKASETCQ